jgi:hypothetical protein
MDNSTNKIQICSIDIGKKNLCFYIQEIDILELSKIKNIPLKDRYNIDGSLTNQMKLLLDQIYKNGKTILFKNNDITENCNPKLYFDPEFFHNINDLFDSYLPYFNNCSYFIIEQQMQFGRFKQNTMALKIGNHCFSYFTFKYGRFKHIIDFPSYHKTQILGCPKIKGKVNKKGIQQWLSITKYNRKKWTVVKAEEILRLRGELSIWEDISKIKKKDDLADTLCQLMSFVYLHFIDS